MRIALLTLALLALSPAVHAVDHTTQGLLNGRAWNGELARIKLGYLVGYVEGAKIVGANADITTVKPNFLESLTPALSRGETVKALDTFYATPENLNIPIFGALMIIAARVRGMAETEIQTKIDAARRMYPHADPQEQGK